MKSNRIAIIPARGGSKRIPNKNIIDFNGKPLIAWTIEEAIKSNVFAKVVVSTDSRDIADISKEYGAEAPFLRDIHADDYSPVSEGTLRTLQQLEEIGEVYAQVVQLFAVCPLRTATDILESINFFDSKKIDFLISCFKYTWMNPWWATTLNEKSEPTWVFEDTKKRSQDLPELFSPTGAIWIANVSELKKANTFYGPGHVFWEMNWKRAVDIDNYEDLELAKALFKTDENL